MESLAHAFATSTATCFFAIAIFLMVAGLGGLAQAVEPSAKVIVLDVKHPGNPISPLLFSSNLEHTRRAVWKGLGSELLANRKFAGENVAEGRKKARVVRGKPSPEGVVARWEGVGVPAAKFSPDLKEAYCGTQSQRIESFAGSRPVGIRQGGIPLEAGREYGARFQLKVMSVTTVTVRLTDASGRVEYARQSNHLEPGDWREWTFRFKVSKTDPESGLEVTFEGPGTLWVGSASVVSVDHFHGMRRDVIARLKEMSVPLLRWPGGNFTRDYRWKEGLLPIDRRPPIALSWAEVLPFTENYDFHDIGIDEFMALCRELGAIPSITVRLGDGGDQEAGDWVEYCNGSAETRWGKIRAARGHPEPYNVKYWSIGNEVYGYWMFQKPFDAESYAQVVRQYSTAMRKVDPSLVLTVAGLDANWDRTLISKATGYFDWLARHEYPPITEALTGPKAAAEFKRQARRPQEFIRPWLAEARRDMDSLGPNGKKIGLSFDEWNLWHLYFPNPQANAWHIGPIDAAFLAAQFNMLCREAPVLNIQMAAMFQPVNEGAIEVKPFSAELTAMGQIFELYRVHHGGRLLATPSPMGNDEIDASASLSSDGRFVRVTVVNRDDHASRFSLVLDGANPRSATATILSVKELLPDARMDARKSELPVGRRDGKLTVEVPRFGICLLKVELQP